MRKLCQFQLQYQFQQCTTNACPNDRVDSPNFQCGQKCKTSDGAFEYTFKGEKFGIYGTY